MRAQGSKGWESCKQCDDQRCLVANYVQLWKEVMLAAQENLLADRLRGTETPTTTFWHRHLKSKNRIETPYLLYFPYSILVSER